MSAVSVTGAVPASERPASSLGIHRFAVTSFAWWFVKEFGTLKQVLRMIRRLECRLYRRLALRHWQMRFTQKDSPVERKVILLARSLRTRKRLSMTRVILRPCSTVGSRMTR
jgi:hypothetical protein